MKRIAVLLAVIALALAGVAWLWLSGARDAGPGGGRERAQREVPVTVAAVARQRVPLGFPATATIEAISSIPLRARADGEVTAVHVGDGAMVKAGQPILDIDARQADAEIAAQRAAVARDEASLAKAERDLQRAASLAQVQAQSKVTVADAQTERDLARAALAADKAKLEQLLATREYYTLAAPMDGRIGRINARAGTWLKSSDSFIATLVAFDPVYAAVGVPQNQIADVAAAVAEQTARIEVTVPGRDEVLSGPIKVIENEADADTGLIMVRAEIANAGPRLWPGQIADGRVILRDEEDAVTLPDEAVQTAQGGTYVYVAEAGVAKRRAVRIARSTGGLSIVAEGVKPGEQVVTDGQLQLQDGAKIAVKGP